MPSYKFRTIGVSPALMHAKYFLEEAGWEYDLHGNYVLLPVPSGNLTVELPKDRCTMIGGNFPSDYICKYKCIDLLQDPIYLAENANITAHCALRYAIDQLPVILAGCPILILGWGRIGKCLSQLLQHMGAAVTVYARNLRDRATILSLGYNTTDNLSELSLYRVIFNTVPTVLIDSAPSFEKQVRIDLASSPGILGKDVIWARGLPGKDAPESSGRLIADTIERLRKEDLL